MTEIKIRKATYDDAEQYVKLNVDVWCSAYSEIMPAEVLKSRREKQNFHIENFKNRDINKNGHIDLVAEIEGKIVGQLSGVSKSRIDFFGEKQFAEICALYVLPDFQHVGIGKRLVDTFVNEIKSLVINKYVIGVLKANNKARKAYEKYGGVLSKYNGLFETCGEKFEEVYYTYNIN